MILIFCWISTTLAIEYKRGNCEPKTLVNGGKECANEECKTDPVLFSKISQTLYETQQANLQNNKTQEVTKYINCFSYNYDENNNCVPDIDENFSYIKFGCEVAPTDNTGVEVSIAVPVGTTVMALLALGILAFMGYYCYNKHRNYQVGIHDDEQI